MDLVDVFSLLTSIVALICSIITWDKSNQNSKKINNINLESEIYMDIFKDFLTKKLPAARDKIYIDREGTVNEYDELTEQLFNLKKNSIYFEYRNPDFYSQLKRKSDLIEDKLVKTEGMHYRGKESNTFLNEIDDLLEELYRFILNNYFGDL